MKGKLIGLFVLAFSWATCNTHVSASEGSDVASLKPESVEAAFGAVERTIEEGEFEHASQGLKDLVESASSLSPIESASVHVRAAAYALRIGDYSTAEKFFRDAAEHAQKGGSEPLSTAAAVNALQAQIDNLDYKQLPQRTDLLRKRIDSISSDQLRGQYLVRLAHLVQRSVFELEEDESNLELAVVLIRNALSLEIDPMDRVKGLALLGRHYEFKRQLDDALSYTNKAAFLAQSMQADEFSFELEWQLGRLLRERKESGAIEAYRRALIALQNVQASLIARSPRYFSLRVAPLYRDYAGVLISELASLDDAAERDQVLRSVVSLLETLKQGEVEDYYSRECLVKRSLGENTGDLYQHTAILYPVILEDRLEILVEINGVLARHSADINRADLESLVERLRVSLERNLTGGAYLPLSQRLYQLIVAPLQPELDAQKIDTLVFIPDGALRTIPPAVLHDGVSHLIEKYAVVIQPAMTLLPADIPQSERRLFAGGISDAVGGFPGLPHVTMELEQISAVAASDTFANREFNLVALQQNLPSGSFSSAHFATHGEFNKDFRKSFVLAYDGRLSVTSLQRMLLERPSDSPLDLLVLSACQTAVGDDRAALGLAGIAVQSGARSALASLWSISDAATAQIMVQFYRSLGAGGSTKAESLRQAQVSLLKTEEFGHPSFWAPYILTGDWR